MPQGKRVSKGVPETILPDPLITVLIGELDVLVCAIVKYTSVIQRYYIEYLKGAHLTSLRKLIQVRTAVALEEMLVTCFVLWHAVVVATRLDSTAVEGYGLEVVCVFFLCVAGVCGL